MLVKENKLLNPTIKMPTFGRANDKGRIEGTKLIVDTLSAYMVNFFTETTDPLDSAKTYYVGVRGTMTDDITMYKGAGYSKPTSHNELHYIKNSGNVPLHLKGSGGSVIVKSVFITDGEPDIVVPNKKDFTEDIQAYYPPEGNYKEIEPR